MSAIVGKTMTIVTMEQMATIAKVSQSVGFLYERCMLTLAGLVSMESPIPAHDDLDTAE